MSDVDSESSTESLNHGVSLFFNHFLGMPSRRVRVFRYENPNSEMDDNSSDYVYSIDGDSSSSSENLESLNDSDELDESDEDDFCCSRNSSIVKLFNQRYTNKIKNNHLNQSVSNNWWLPKELYNREIGQYNHRAQWGYKFYQSAFAVQKLRLSKQLKGHQGCVNSLDFNKTGKVIVSGSDDLRIRLWNWTTGNCIQSLRSKHSKNIFQTKFLSTQCANIVSCGRDGRVIFTDVNCADGNFSKVIGYHDISCNKLSVHDDTPYVVLSCGEDGIVKNIDIRESPINENKTVSNILYINNVRGNTMRLYGIDINPMKSNEFIVNGDDEYVRMYDKRKLSNNPIKIFHRQLKCTKSEKADKRVTNDTGNGDVVGINNDAINDTGNGDVVGINNGAINDTGNGDVVGINNGAINDTDNSHASASTDGRSLSDTILLPFELSRITSAVYNYCGNEILASYSKDDIYLFDAYGESNNVIHSYSGHLNRMTVKGVNFYGPRSDYVVSGSDCGSIFIWDKKTEAIVQKKKADIKGTINVLEAHPHMPTLATSGLDSTIKIWEPLNSSRQLQKKKLEKAVVINRLEKIQTLQSLM